MAFKDLIRGVKINNAQDTKILTKPIFYPLNQYNKSYIEKTKSGISEINWRELINQIQNEVEEDFETNDLVDY